MRKTISLIIENKKNDGENILEEGLRRALIEFKNYEILEAEKILKDFQEYCKMSHEYFNIELTGCPFIFTYEYGDYVSFDTSEFDSDVEAIKELRKIWKTFKEVLTKFKKAEKTVLAKEKKEEARLIVSLMKSMKKDSNKIMNNLNIEKIMDVERRY